MNSYFYLEQAAEAAAKISPQATNPNPRVGCVVVRDGKILSTGVHQQYKREHAEVAALKKLEPADLKLATVYITLEPCIHFKGKSTPACTDLLIKHQPQHVIIGTLDVHFPGKGVAALEAAGIKVTVLHSSHHQRLNPWYQVWHTKKRPFITLKVAQSLDGKINHTPAEHAKGTRIITNQASRNVVQTLRQQHRAILTTTNTILADNPQLNVRGTKTTNQVDVIILGTSKLNKDLKVFQTPDRTVYQVDSLKAFQELCQKQAMVSVLTECGAHLNQQLLEQDLVDQVEVFIAPTFFGNLAKNSFLAPYTLNNFTLANSQAHQHDLQLSYHRLN